MSGRFPVRPFRSLAFFLVIAFFGIAIAFAGEPQWVEVRSPNFSVVTDAGEKRGREVAMRFEQMRGAYGALTSKENVSIPVPLQIVAFRNTKEMRQVAPMFNGKPTELAGLFQGGEDRSFIMLDMSVENPWVVVFHEYAHQLLNGNLKDAFDPWFQEGFAEYFSTIEVDGKQAHVGKIPSLDYTILQQLGMMKISDLFRVQPDSSTYNESGDHRNTFYAESSMVMHYIYDNKLIANVGMYFDLKENKHVSVDDAIQQAFGMSAAQFDKMLRNYWASGHYMFYSIPAPASMSSNTFTVTAMSVGDSGAVLADIHLHSRDYQDRALSEFQELVKSDPKNAAACRGLGYAYLQRQQFDQAAEYFSRASQLNSKDPRVHYYNALLMARKSGFAKSADLPTLTRELETSISLDANFADSYALLSFAQSMDGHPAEGLITMRKALAISPRNQQYLFNYANLYLANRQPDPAIKILQSLRATDNPQMASQVSALLDHAQQFKESLEQDAEIVDADRTSEKKDVVIGHVTVSAPPARSGPAKFLKGALTNADCSPTPSILLTVVSGAKTWKMKVADRNHLILIGADQFSCAWNKKKVAVNYRETGDGEADVISLEIQ
jgi:tetratricopeptide (TPR) repeat protein